MNGFEALKLTYTFAPSALFLEGDWDYQKEKEGYKPSKSNPQSKPENDRLCHKHVRSFHAKVMQHLLEASLLQLHFCFVAFVTGCLAQGLCLVGKSDATTSLLKDKEDEDKDWYACEALDAFYLSLSQGFVDEASVD